MIYRENEQKRNMAMMIRPTPRRLDVKAENERIFCIITKAAMLLDSSLQLTVWMNECWFRSEMGKSRFFSLKPSQVFFQSTLKSC